MPFRAVLSLSPVISTVLEGSVISPSSEILIVVLLISRVPADIFIIAGVGYIPRLFITSRDTFFVRRRTLPVIFPEL
jgi:hypothetical protein